MNAASTHTNTNGQCPHCKRMFDVRKAILAFPGKFTGNRISLAFALCPDCYDAFKHGNTNRQAIIIKTSFTNVVNNRNIDWSMTNSIALDTHFGDFFNAWWFGVDIPKPVFDAINNGSVDEVAFSPAWNVTGGQHV
jgi:hypothetical protein